MSSELKAIESVRAPSPGVALDMLITMKMARNLRQISTKIDTGDWKGVSDFISSPWSSGTARFTRKNQVLESLAKSVAGVASGSELDSDPAFYSETTPDSLRVTPTDSARPPLLPLVPRPFWHVETSLTRELGCLPSRCNKKRPTFTPS